ncbi:MAG: tail fiber protein [Methylobacterium frigidaeris]
MSDPFVGEIRMFAGNFAPSGWALCQGQTLPIASNSTLFSLLGTAYGGDGVTTFKLPDLRGRVPMNWGQGPGLSLRVIGEQDGSETVTLLASQMPAHNHLLAASSAGGDQPSPAETFIAETIDGTTGNPTDAFASSANATMNPAVVTSAGGSESHPNLQPSLCVSFIIALQGIFPSRN